MHPEAQDDPVHLDEQDVAELLDEESLGTDEVEAAPQDGYVHTVLGAPDQLGADDVAELVASEFPADGPLAPEEGALHYES